MSLDDRLQDLADQLGKPLVVLDVDLRVMAVSVHETDLDRMRLSLLSAGKNVALTDTMVKQHRLTSAVGPVRVSSGADDTMRVVLPLRHEKRLFGYLYYWDDSVRGDLSQQEQDLLADGGAELGMLLSFRLSDLHYRMEHSRRLLTGLLGESSADRSRCAFGLLEEGLIENVDQYSVLVYRTPGASSISVTRLAVEATMEFTARSTTVKIVGGILGSEGVLLFPRRVNRTRLQAIMARPGLEQARAGVGSVQGSLVQAAESYREARLAWQASRADPARYGRAAFWDDLGVDRLLLQLPLQDLTPTQFPAGVGRLLESPNGRDLARTLDTYLSAGGDVKETARRLGIHRSTLYYRLDRIRDVTGCDISDGVTRMDLHTGLRVAQLAGILPSPLESDGASE